MQGCRVVATGRRGCPPLICPRLMSRTRRRRAHRRQCCCPKIEVLQAERALLISEPTDSQYKQMTRRLSGGRQTGRQRPSGSLRVPQPHQKYRHLQRRLSLCNSKNRELRLAMMRWTCWRLSGALRRVQSRSHHLQNCCACRMNALSKMECFQKQIQIYGRIYSSQVMVW